MLDELLLTVLLLGDEDELLLALIVTLLLDMLELLAVDRLDIDRLDCVLSELNDSVWCELELLDAVLAVETLELVLLLALDDELLLLEADEKLEADKVEKLDELRLDALLDDTEILLELRLDTELVLRLDVLRLLAELSLISSTARIRRSCAATLIPALALLT